MINLMQTLGSHLTTDYGSGQKKHTLPRKQLTSERTGKRTGALAIALILLSSLALANLSYAAGRLFYDGFENGTTDAWAVESGRNRCIVVTSSPRRYRRSAQRQVYGPVQLENCQ